MKRKWNILAFGAVGCMLVVLWPIYAVERGIHAANHARYPGPRTILVSNSPDKRFRLFIREQVPTPVPLQQSPYLYEMTVYSLPGMTALPGAVAIQNNDSCSSNPSDFAVTWGASSVSVGCSNPVSSHVAELSTGAQVWR